MNRKELQKVLFKLGTIIEIATVFIFAICRKDIVMYVGFTLAILLIVFGNFHKKTVEEKKLEQIELNDEINILIRDKAQSKTNLIMIYLALLIIILLAITGKYTASVLVSIAIIVDSLIVQLLIYYYNKRL